MAYSAPPPPQYRPRLTTYSCSPLHNLLRLMFAAVKTYLILSILENKEGRSDGESLLGRIFIKQDYNVVNNHGAAITTGACCSPCGPQRNASIMEAFLFLACNKQFIHNIPLVSLYGRVLLLLEYWDCGHGHCVFSCTAVSSKSQSRPSPRA